MTGTPANDDPDSMARAALEAFRKQRAATDKQMEEVRSVGKAAKNNLTGSALFDVRAQAEAALLTAESNRELAMATIAATEILDVSLRTVNGQITAGASTVS